MENKTNRSQAMIRWLISKVRRIVGSIREMATYWTSIGVMLIPIGVAILIAWPDLKSLVFVIISIGFTLGLIGLSLTIKEARDRHNKALKDEEDRTLERKQRDKEYKQRDIEHERYMLMLTESGERLGISKAELNQKLRTQNTRRRNKDGELVD